MTTTRQEALAEDLEAEYRAEGGFQTAHRSHEDFMEQAAQILAGDFDAMVGSDGFTDLRDEEEAQRELDEAEMAHLRNLGPVDDGLFGHV